MKAWAKRATQESRTNNLLAVRHSGYIQFMVLWQTIKQVCCDIWLFNINRYQPDYLHAPWLADLTSFLQSKKKEFREFIYRNWLFNNLLIIVSISNSKWNYLVILLLCVCTAILQHCQTIIWKLKNEEKIRLFSVPVTRVCFSFHCRAKT